MRICRVKATNKIIESQSGGKGQKDLDVLMSNAVAMGFEESDVEALYAGPQPSRYHDSHDGVQWIENNDLKDSAADALERENEKAVEQDLSDLKNQSIANKRNKIHLIIDEATDLETLKQATKDAFDKIMPWIN